MGVGAVSILFFTYYCESMVLILFKSVVPIINTRQEWDYLNEIHCLRKEALEISFIGSRSIVELFVEDTVGWTLIFRLLVKQKKSECFV